MGDFDILLPDLCFNILHIDIERDRERFRKKHPHHSHVSCVRCLQIKVPAADVLISNVALPAAVLWYVPLGCMGVWRHPPAMETLGELI